MYLTQYNPSSGILVSGNSEYQKLTAKYNSVFNFVSNVYTDLTVFSIDNRDCIDSCWESGNIYYSDNSTNKLTKIKYDTTLLYELQLTNPSSLSVIQNAAKMIITENVEDKGVVVIDGNNLIKTDKELNIEHTLTFPSPCSFVYHSRIDNGCFLIYSNNIFRFNSDYDLIASGTSLITDIKQICVNSYGDLFILGKYYIYKYSVLNGVITLVKSFNLSPYFGSSSVSCFDIATKDQYQYIYIAGGNAVNTRVMKFNKDLTYYGSLLTTSEFPYILKIPQHPTSSTMYILCDDTKYSTFESSSSSTSSESSTS